MWMYRDEKGNLIEALFTGNLAILENKFSAEEREDREEAEARAAEEAVARAKAEAAAKEAERKELRKTIYGRYLDDFVHSVGIFAPRNYE